MPIDRVTIRMCLLVWLNDSKCSIMKLLVLPAIVCSLIDWVGKLS